MTSFFGSVLRFRLLILAIALGVLSIGAIQLRKAAVDVLPEFTPPYAEIQTEALGLSADEVEQLITVPLEADLLNGVEGVDVIRSESVPGLSSIVLVFTPGTDVYRARQLVEERLTQAHALPNVSKPPTLLQPLSSTNRVLMIGLSSSDLSLIEQSVIARWTIRPQLMGVRGVANVSVWGMRDQQLQVQVNPERLRDRKVTLNQVITTTGNAQVVSPLTFLEASTPGTGGFVETPQQRLQVRHLLEKIADPGELAKVPVEGTGGGLQLGDVADIKVDHQPLIGDAVVSGGPGLFLVVEKFPGVSTTEVTKGVEDALTKLRPGLTGITSDTTVFRPADYVADALGNLRLALLVGGLLMLLTLVVLRFSWRGTVIALVTVPLSLAAAGLVLNLTGQSFNALVFAGLAAAVAVVVDEAVAPSAEVVRSLQRSQFTNTPRALSSALAGASAVARRPLIYAALVALLAILPLATLGGRPGAFFTPLVSSYALAVVAAILVGLTVTPALTALLFSRWGGAPAREPGWSRRLSGRYEAALGGFGGRLRTVLFAAAGCAVIGVVASLFLNTALIPTFADRNVVVRLESQPGTSNVKMTEQTTQVSRALQALPGVSSVGAHVGRAVTGDRVVDVNSSDIWVTIKPDADYDDTLAAIRNAAAAVPDATPEVMSYTTQKMRDVGALISGDNTVQGSHLNVLTGLDQPIAVRLYGQDSEVLAQQAARVQQLLTGVKGIVDPRVITSDTAPTLEIEVDLAKARAAGITPGDVRRAEAVLLQGIQVGSVFEDQKVFDVIVQGAPATRSSVAQVRNLLIDLPNGGHIRLGQVADVRVVQRPAVIQRDAVSRRMDVVAQVKDRSVDAVAADIKQQISLLNFPLEYHAEVLQQTAADEMGAGRAIGVAVAAVLAAFLLFQAAFRSWRLALVQTIALPLALVGGLVGSLFTGRELSIGSLLGLLAVLGLAARTGVTMITELQAAEVPGSDRASTVPAVARDRLAPVLISLLALAALVLPFVVLGPRPGLEIVHPLAVVLLGGLVTIALVTLFALPAIYRHVAPDTPPEPLADEDQLMRSEDDDTAAPPGDDVQPRELATVGSSTQGRP
jgi:Cu/Ag efflux pump CusA